VLDLKILFLIVNQEKAYSGAVRPFLNLAKGCANTEQVSIALFRSRDLLNQLESNMRQSVIVAEEKTAFLREVLKLKPDFVIGDDTSPSLQILKYLQSTRSAVFSYAQILFGSHSISRCFDVSCLPLREQIMYRSSQFIPFLMLSNRYSDYLRGCSGVLANSKATTTMLHILYNVDTAGVVYPPVDTDVFRPISPERHNSPEITLYLGSLAGDSRMVDIRATVEKTLELGYKVNTIGNQAIAAKLGEEYEGLIFHQNLRDEELADLYSKSSVTICPQKWETFGYVSAESMACGTPVIAFNCMGSQETILDNVTGKLANSSKELLHHIGCVLGEKTTIFHQEELRRHVVTNFSVTACAEQLIRLLRNGRSKTF
jgi:hypothetical protein